MNIVADFGIAVGAVAAMVGLGFLAAYIVDKFQGWAPLSAKEAPILERKTTRSGTLHAYQITRMDAALIKMMAGANFGPDVEVTLPSGIKITGAEMAFWVDSTAEQNVWTV